MTEKKNSLHICFVSDRSYPLFVQSDCRLIGGVETRSLRLAKMMAKYFNKISFAIKETGLPIVDDHGLSVVTYTPDSVSDKPNPGIAKINADIYICFESNHITADVVRSCNILGKTVVYWCTSNLDFAVNYQLGNHNIDSRNFVNSECAYAFYFADYIVSQTKDQQKILKNNHGLDSVVIRNPISFPSSLPRSERDVIGTPKVLWIGRTCPINKRPQLLLSVAEKLPEIQFVMVMNNFNQIIFDEISKSASPNVEIIDYVPSEKMEQIFTQSHVFLSTSHSQAEGFPNVFLHSIVHGLPIVSLEVDPDQILSAHGCGICCNGNIDTAVDVIRDLFKKPDKYSEIATHAFAHAKQYYNSEVIADELATFLNAIPKRPFSSKWTEIIFDADRSQEYLESENIRLEQLIEALTTNQKALEEEYKMLTNSKPIKIANFLRTIKKRFLMLS